MGEPISTRIKQSHKALDLFKRVIRLNEEHQLGPSPTLWNTYYYMGFYYGRDEKDEKECFSHLNAAFRISKQLADSMLIGRSYSAKGLFFWDFDKIDSSLVNLHRATELLETQLGPTHQLVLNQYGHIGLIYLELGDYNKAHYLLQHPIPTCLGCSRGSSGFGSSRSKEKPTSLMCATPKWVIFIYQWVIWLRQNHFTKKTSVGSARHYYYLATIQHKRGNYHQAIEIFRQGDSVAHYHAPFQNGYLHTLYLSIAQSYRELNQLDSALMYLEMAVDTFEHYSPGEARSFQADVLHINGEIQIKLGQHLLAQQYLSQSRQIYERVFGPYNLNVASVYISLGKNAEEAGEYKASLDFYQQALHTLSGDFTSRGWGTNPPFGQVQGQVEYLEILGAKARILKKYDADQQSDIRFLDASLQNSLMALKLIDTMRISYLKPESKDLLIEEAGYIFEDGIETALQLFAITGEPEYYEQAFAFVEKSKAFTLLEGLREAQAIEFANIPSELVEKEKQLKVELKWYQRQYYEHMATGKEWRNAQVVATKWPIYEKKKEYEALVRHLEENYPEYYRLKYDLTHATVSEIRNQLQNDQKAVIEYFVGEKQLFAFIITKSDQKFVQLPLNTDMTSQLDSFLNLLHSGPVPEEKMLNWLQLFQPDTSAMAQTCNRTTGFRH